MHGTVMHRVETTDKKGYRTEGTGYVQWCARVKAVLHSSAPGTREVGGRCWQQGAMALGAAFPLEHQWAIPRGEWCKRVYVHREFKAL